MFGSVPTHMCVKYLASNSGFVIISLSLCLTVHSCILICCSQDEQTNYNDSLQRLNYGIRQTVVWCVTNCE